MRLVFALDFWREVKRDLFHYGRLDWRNFATKQLFVDEVVPEIGRLLEKFGYDLLHCAGWADTVFLDFSFI